MAARRSLGVLGPQTAMPTEDALVRPPISETANQAAVLTGAEPSNHCFIDTLTGNRITCSILRPWNRPQCTPWSRKPCYRPTA